MRITLPLWIHVLYGIGLSAIIGALSTAVALAEDAYASETNPAFESRFAGEFAAGLQAFRKSGELPGQADGHLFPFLEGKVRFDGFWNDGRDRITLQPYGRWDIRTNRDLLDLQDGYYLHIADTWDMLLGVHTVFWGVTEARPLVNIINQVDGLGDIDDKNRLGQPMLNVNVVSPDYGTLSLYGLYGFREREFPTTRDRLRLPITIAEDQARFEKDGFSRHAAFALRYSHVIDLNPASLDLALSYFTGTGREPRLIPGNGVLIPFYDTIRQVGLEGLFVLEDWQFKYEGIWRSQADEEFAAGSAGVEYTITDAFGTGTNIGLIGEYLFDNRSAAMPPTFYDRNVFVGLRLTDNDLRNTRLLAGLTLSARDSENLFWLEFSRLLSDDLQLEVEARVFAGFERDDTGFDPGQDSYILTRFRRFF